MWRLALKQLLAGAGRYFFGALLLSACLAGACGNDDSPEARKETSAETKASGSAPVASAPDKAGGAEKPSVSPAPPASPAERETAGRLLEFANNADREFSEGYYALPDALNALASGYRKNWLLPRGVRIPARAGKPLVPPPGLFSAQEEKLLARSLADMDKALADIAETYRRLENYVADASIVDNGRLGRQLTGQIASRHAVFMAARKSWRAIVAARARDAELALLRGHPLERQIIAAGQIFELMRQAAEIIAAGEPDRQDLRAISGQIEQRLETGAMPPFPAAPAQERLYRDFLKNVRVYITALNRGINEGFFRPQTRELAARAQSCRLAYNEFARTINRG